MHLRSILKKLKIEQLRNIVDWLSGLRGCIPLFDEPLFKRKKNTVVLAPEIWKPKETVASKPAQKLVEVDLHPSIPLSVKTVKLTSQICFFANGFFGLVFFLYGADLLYKMVAGLFLLNSWGWVNVYRKVGRR